LLPAASWLTLTACEEELNSGFTSTG